MKKSRIIVIGLLAVCVVVGVGYRFTRDQKTVLVEEVRPVVLVEPPLETDIINYTTLIGTIEPENVVNVLPKMSGEVLAINFAVGDQVTEGQVLCTIDSDALTMLKIQVDTAQVAVNDAALNLSRTQALYDTGSVSQQMLEQAQSASKNARLQYEAAKNSYDLQVKYMDVVAPTSGVIESKSVDLHDTVSPSTPICVISVKDQIRVNFGVSEQVLENLVPGAEITLEKQGVNYQGVVSEISSMVDSETGLYSVKAFVDEGDALTTGSKIKVSTVLSRSLNAVTIPLDAVLYDKGNPFVYKYEDGLAIKVDFEGGVYDMQRMEVISGLSPADQIITTWSNELTDQAAVVLQPGAAETENIEDTVLESSN